MGMRYLFSDQELFLLINLHNRMSGVFLSDSELEAAEGLIEKNYIHMDGTTMVLEPFIVLVLDVLNHYEKKLEFMSGVLYQGSVLIWIEEDSRKLQGKILSIYPDIKAWYQEQSEAQNMELSLEECRLRLNEMSETTK